MTRYTSRTTRGIGRGVDAAVGAWERGELDRRTLLRRAAMLGMSAPALAMLMGRAATPAVSAAALRALQDDPAAGVMGGTLRVATIGEPPHLRVPGTRPSALGEGGNAPCRRDYPNTLHPNSV